MSSEGKTSVEQAGSSLQPAHPGGAAIACCWREAGLPRVSRGAAGVGQGRPARAGLAAILQLAGEAHFKQQVDLLTVDAPRAPGIARVLVCSNKHTHSR